MSLIFFQRKKTAAERAKDNYQSGGWSTGQKWADDAPKEELDPDDINLMNIGACGAFVHGLEDEFSGKLKVLLPLKTDLGGYMVLASSSHVFF